MDRLKAFSLQGMDLSYVLGLLAAFIGVLVLMAAIHHIVVEPLRRRRQAQQRLKGAKREQDVRAQIFKTEMESGNSIVLSVVEKVTGWGKVENLQRQLLQGDIYVSPSFFLCMVGILGSMGSILGMLLSNILGGLGLGLIMGLAPIGLLRWKQKRKTLKFEKYMPEAMELLARSLRAGHTLASALDLVSQEIPSPLGIEMRITYEEQRLGLSMVQAMRRMGERVASRDLRFFVTAVLIQSESGGNLAEILDNIGLLIRDRLKLKGKVQGLTAEGRFSALILGLLPIVTFLGLYAINSQYISTLLTDPLGHRFLMAGIISVTFGALIMKKMVNIKV